MTDTNENPQRDWRDTVFLPKTDFPMKAGLPQKEPAILAKWQEGKLYDRLRDARRGREKLRERRIRYVKHGAGLAFFTGGKEVFSQAKALQLPAPRGEGFGKARCFAWLCWAAWLVRQ